MEKWTSRSVRLQALPTVNLRRSAGATSCAAIPTGMKADRAHASKHPDQTNLIERPDIPVVRHAIRGSKKRGLEIAASPHLMSDAKSAYEADKHARTAAGPRQGYWKTWCDFHVQCFGEALPPLPLTPEKICTIASVFKAAKYRAYENYLSRAREAGHEWSDRVRLEAIASIRSVTRGIGPSKQSMPFPVTSVPPTSQWPDEPFCRDGPVNAFALMVVGCAFLLREIEAATLVWSDVELNDESSLVRLTLPVSKTDPTARGCTRHWGCTCQSGPLQLCPFHVLISHKTSLMQRGLSTIGLAPLFPNAHGMTPTKTAMVESVVSAAERLGETRHDSNGVNRYGGHSLRTGGAYWLATSGMELLKIELLGRWRSSLVAHYAGQAPLCNLSQDLARAQNYATLRETMDELASTVRGVDDKLKRYDATTREWLEQELTNIRDVQQKQIQLQTTQFEPTFVLNTTSKVLHRVVIGQGLPQQWRAGCGWRFAWAPHRQMSLKEADKLEGPRCEKCLPTCPADDSSSESSS
eukprot:6489007-Amphidinium_carterae.1